MAARLKIRTERQAIVSAGVSQVLTSNHVLTWGVEVYWEAANANPLVIGNDGNDTVSLSTGSIINPGGSKTFSSNDFFSPYETYVDMSTIFVTSQSQGFYRLLYWVGV